MNCLPFEEKIAQYLDGDLDRAEVRLVEAHLRSCAACAEFADQLENDRILLRMPPPETADVDFASLRKQIRMRVVEERRRSILMPALLIAASILIAVGIAAIRFAPGRVHWQPPSIAHVNAPEPPAPNDARQAEAPAPQFPEQVGQALPPAKRNTVHTAPPAAIPQADPALEAALQEFLAAEKAPAVSPEAASPVEIRIVTGDPNVVLILLQETSGVSNE